MLGAPPVRAAGALRESRQLCSSAYFLPPRRRQSRHADGAGTYCWHYSVVMMAWLLAIESALAGLWAARTKLGYDDARSIGFGRDGQLHADTADALAAEYGIIGHADRPPCVPRRRLHSPCRISTDFSFSPLCRRWSRRGRFSGRWGARRYEAVSIAEACRLPSYHFSLAGPASTLGASLRRDSRSHAH